MRVIWHPVSKLAHDNDGESEAGNPAFTMPLLSLRSPRFSHALLKPFFRPPSNILC